MNVAKRTRFGNAAPMLAAVAIWSATAMVASAAIDTGDSASTPAVSSAADVRFVSEAIPSASYQGDEAFSVHPLDVQPPPVPEPNYGFGAGMIALAGIFAFGFRKLKPAARLSN